MDMATIFMIDITRQYELGPVDIRKAMENASLEEMFKFIYSDAVADSALKTSLQKMLDMVCALHRVEYADQGWKQIFKGFTLCASTKCSHELDIMKGAPRTAFVAPSKQTRTKNGKEVATQIVSADPCDGSSKDPELNPCGGRAAIRATFNAQTDSRDDDNPHVDDDDDPPAVQLDQQKGTSVVAKMVDDDNRAAYSQLYSHLSLFGMLTWHAKQCDATVCSGVGKDVMIFSIKNAFAESFITSPFYKDRFRRIIRLAFAMAIDTETTIGRQIASVYKEPDTLKSKLQDHIQNTAPFMLEAIHKCILAPCIDNIFNDIDTLADVAKAVTGARLNFERKSRGYLIDAMVVLGSFVQKNTPAGIVLVSPPQDGKSPEMLLADAVNESLEQLKVHNIRRDASPLTIVEKPCSPSFAAIASQSFRSDEFNENDYPSATNQMVRRGGEAKFARRIETSFEFYNQVKNTSLPGVNMESIFYLARPKPNSSSPSAAPGASTDGNVNRSFRSRVGAKAAAAGAVAVDQASTAARNLCKLTAGIKQEQFDFYFNELKPTPSDGRSSPTKKMRLDLPSAIPETGALESLIAANCTEKLAEPQLFYHLFSIVKRFKGNGAAENAIKPIRKENRKPFIKEFQKECEKWKQYFATKKFMASQSAIGARP